MKTNTWEAEKTFFILQTAANLRQCLFSAIMQTEKFTVPSESWRNAEFALLSTAATPTSSKYQQKCAELTEEREKAPAAAVYSGSLYALSDLINCCGIIRQSSFAAALLEMIGIILGFVLVTLFLFTGNIRSLAMYVLMAFQMFWLAAITIVILLRKKI